MQRLLIVFALALPACNVFFPTGSVEFGDDTAGSGECTSASCSCTDDCDQTCTRNCEIRCESGSTCDFALERGGEVFCEDGATCNVECEGGDCEVECQGECTLQCGGNAGACGWSECDGRNRICGARGLACNSDCPE